MEARTDIIEALREGGVMATTSPPATLDEIYLAAQSLDYWRMAVPCQGAGSKAALLTKISDALQFPDHFGMNLDALYDCLTDQLIGHVGKGKKGAVIVLQGTAQLPKEALSPVIETLLDAADFVQMKGSRLCVVKLG